MSLSKEVLEDLASTSTGVLPYKTFLSELSKSSSALECIESFSLGRELDITKFSVLLTTLRVPGPCDLLHGKSDLGRGAQFAVAKQEVNGLTDSKLPVAAVNNSVDVAAVKTPHFFLDGQTKLDLSSPEVSRQVRNMIIEITALCHSNLRDHRNVVDLLGWGTSIETGHQIPFLALELAYKTLADFLRRPKSNPVALRHHIALDIGCGLDAVHATGLIHGDLKPENVLIFDQDSRWVAKLADFGGGADTNEGSILGGLGTVGWRAPELQQFCGLGKRLDTSLLYKIDNYSYGLMLWSLFLRDDSSAPCDEDVDREMVALSELESKSMSLPTSLYSTLKSSLRKLLARSPETRVGEVGRLLDDGSQVYSEWASSQTPKGGIHFSGNELNDSTENWNTRYEWETPEISMHFANVIESAFSTNKPLSSRTIQSLFMKYAGSERLFRPENGHVKDLLLNLLHAGAQKDSQPLRALIYLVHEHYQMIPRPDVEKLRLLWMSEAVAGGAFFLRKAVQSLDRSLYETCLREFHNCGGYNQSYAAMNRTVVLDDPIISEILERISHKNATSLDRVKSLNARGDKILHILSSFSLSKVLKELLELAEPQEVNMLNECGETALYRACMGGHASNVLLLLSHGADPSIPPSPSGPTCLHWLFHFSAGEVETISKELFIHGAQINPISKQRIPMLHYPFSLPIGTPLHWAVDMSAGKAALALLRLGANPSFRDGSDPYAYDENIRHLNRSLPPDWIRFSVAENTTLGYSAIDLAVKNLDHEILGTLLSSNSSIDPNDSDEEGYSAMHRLDAGVWRHTIHGTAIWCPLFQGSTATRTEALRETVAVLLQYGFKCEKLTNSKQPTSSGLGFSGQTALMIAVTKGSTGTIRTLLDAGADVNAANAEGETALLSFTDYYLFDETKQSEAVSLLLGMNANLHVRDSRKRTPFLVAASIGLFEVAKRLLNHGANLKDRISYTKSSQKGITAFALLARCPLHQVSEHDEWFTSQLKLHILPRLSQLDGLELRNDLLEKADLNHGTLLHYTAMEGLIRSCATLIEAKVNINGLRRRTKFRRGGTIVSYRTPLDESLKSGNYRRRLPEVSEQEHKKAMAVYSDIARLLKDAGGKQSKDLIAKEFNAPY